MLVFLCKSTKFLDIISWQAFPGTKTKTHTHTHWNTLFRKYVFLFRWLQGKEELGPQRVLGEGVCQANQGEEHQYRYLTYCQYRKIHMTVLNVPATVSSMFLVHVQAWPRGGANMLSRQFASIPPGPKTKPDSKLGSGHFTSVKPRCLLVRDRAATPLQFWPPFWFSENS